MTHIILGTGGIIIGSFSIFYMIEQINKGRPTPSIKVPLGIFAVCALIVLVC
jgi:hypothetical protein